MSRTRVRTPRTLKPCGTGAAYRRHERRNERPCDACQAWRRAHPPKNSGHTGLAAQGHLMLIPGIVEPAGLCLCELNEAHWIGTGPEMSLAGGRAMT